jgi:hypothetical protein
MMGVPALVSIFVTLLGGTMVAADWYDPEQGVLPALLVFHGAAAALTILLVVSMALAVR